MKELFDKIREFDTTQKIALAAVSLLAIVSLILVIVFTTGGNKKEEIPDNTPPIVNPTTMPEDGNLGGEKDPDVNPEDIVRNNTEPPIPETVPEPTSSLSFGVTDLSKEQVIEAQKTTNAALLEFFKWDKKESAESRQKRYSQYFVNDALELSQKPDFNLSDNSDTTIYSGGIINYIEPVGGNKDEYVVLANVAVDIQYNYDKSLEDSIVVKNTESLTLHMKLDGKTWKIKSIEKA